MLPSSYKEAVAKAEAIKALDAGDIYLSNGEFPWHIAESCEPGGSHRLDIYTSVWFRGTDEKTGLRFRWSFDIEPRSANGKGNYEIDANGCREVMEKLRGKCRSEFRRYLSECAKKVGAKAKEWLVLAEKQRHDADVLRTLSK